MTATDTNIATIHEELCLETDTKEKSEDHWNGCTFCLDITAEAKRPGKLPGEHCTTNEDYQFLYTQFPHWRRLLSHDYMRNTDLHDPISPAAPANPAQLVLLHLDDHAWASVQHYFEASRVKHLPDLYRRFTLDSNDPLGYSPAAQGVEFNKTQETRQVPGEALRRALLAKFVQNEDLGKALVATGGAKLVSQCADGVRTEETLMWVRTVLRREEENVSQAYDPHTAKDKQQEILRLMEGVFGKELRALPSGISSSSSNSSENGRKDLVDFLSLPMDVPQNEYSILSISGVPSVPNASNAPLPPPSAVPIAVPTKPVEKKTLKNDAMGYLNQIQQDYSEQPAVFSEFLEIMNSFQSKSINTLQVLERVTQLFNGKPWLIRGFLMFLPPEHLLQQEDLSDIVYVETPQGRKIVIDTQQGTVRFDHL